MERIEDRIDDELIDLGAVSVETQGGTKGDVEAGGKILPGLAED